MVTPDFALLPPSILNLVVLTILLAWLPGTQIFNKPVGVTNLYSTQKDYSTATTYQDLRSIFKVRVCYFPIYVCMCLGLSPGTCDSQRHWVS